MVNVISFTPNGHILNRKLCSAFDGWKSFVYDGTFTVGEFAEKSFADESDIVFICAAGIAVRAVAPFLKDKLSDPAVIVIDEKGRFVVPVLSGHFGGGNSLAMEIASKTGACAVITTSTDVNNVFAVDVFAAKNRLIIKEREMAKKISAALIRGEKIPFLCRLDIDGKTPKGLYSSRKGSIGFVVSPHCENPFERTLHLVSKNVVLGIGCKVGTTLEQIEKAVFAVLGENGIYIEAVSSVASIDIKKQEKGLLEFCSKHGIDLEFYSAADLAKAEGDFSSSKFVLKKTGVDNVCERSAVLKGGSGWLAVKKTALDGVTVAVFMRKESVCFE
ncbi:MAG: cobalamin biosynthesis protein CbiG [Firmicutes bacterium]|nr:cobalamin biosynthesis protein CbiG [Bacillota bacterium]